MPYGSMEVVTSRNLISSRRCFIHFGLEAAQVCRVRAGPGQLDRPFRAGQKAISALRGVSVDRPPSRLVGEDVDVGAAEDDRAPRRALGIRP